MRELVTFSQEASLGSLARRVRTAQQLTQQELADTAGVSPEEVVLFENSLPVPLDIRRRLLKELWAVKAGSDKKAKGQVAVLLPAP